jgi:hypothetical protein
MGQRAPFGVCHANQKCWIEPCLRELTDDRFRDRRSQLWMTGMGAFAPSLYASFWPQAEGLVSGARMQFQTFTSKALFRRRGFIGLVNEAERLCETRSNVAICAYPWGIVICVTVNTTGARQPNAFCHI